MAIQNMSDQEIMYTVGGMGESDDRLAEWLGPDKLKEVNKDLNRNKIKVTGGNTSGSSDRIIGIISESFRKASRSFSNLFKTDTNSMSKTSSSTRLSSVEQCGDGKLLTGKPLDTHVIESRFLSREGWGNALIGPQEV